MRTLLAVLAVLLVAVPCCLGEGHHTVWRRLNVLPVCFEGKGNKPGIVKNFGEDKLIGAVKLVYRSGSIHCSVQKAHDSRWGCYKFPEKSIAAHPLNVIITDKDHHRIFPLDKYLVPGKGFGRGGLWYYLPFTDAKHSDQLVFTNYDEPFYFPRNDRMSVWYGEDLVNFYEGDNVGKVCVDVYAHIL